MADRVSSGDPSIVTYRARVEHVGSTSRRRLALPAEAADAVPEGVVRLVVDGSTYHAGVRSGDAGPVVTGAYGSPRLAREPGSGENRLAEWLDEVCLDAGRSALFDVVVPGLLFGVRAPGATAVYEAVAPPPSSLADIAAGLDE